MKCQFLLVIALTVLGTAWSQDTDSIDLEKSSDSTIDSSNITTSQPPIPTTSAPITTTSATPNVTTEAPITTEVPVTTTEAPQAGLWVVKKDGNVCILAKFGAEMNIEYFLKDNSTSMGTLTLPTNATVNEGSSNCNNDTQVLALDFVGDSSLVLTFKKDGDKVFLNEIAINIKDFRHFYPESKVKARVLDMGNLTDFSVLAGHSYFCSKASVAYEGKSSITFNDIQVQAYRSATDNTFSLAEDCDDDVSNIVPIAVGCALAGLVVVVLIAYLVGRRHKRQRGYESQGL